MVLEHASVPDVVIGPDGKLWVYFVNGEPGKHGIFAARQTDSGGWEVVDCVKLDGRFEGNAVDPNVTRLPDGRYRLVYFLGHFVGGPPPDPDQPHPIYSAISEDGIHFTVEGQLIAVKGVTDPSLVQLPDGRWLLAMTRDGETLLAASDDGAHFQLTGVTIEAMGIPELAVLPDDRVVLYLSKVFVSEDGGQTWEEQPDLRLPGNGADPSLVALPEGGYAFAYKVIAGGGMGVPPGGRPPTPGAEGASGPLPGTGTPGDSGMEMYTQAHSTEVLPQEEYLAQVMTTTPAGSAWTYQTTLFATLPFGNRYDIGGFCRIFRQPDGSGYTTIFGGAYSIREMPEERRYQGVVYRRLGNDLTFQSEPALFYNVGSDLAIDTDGQFYYLTTAHPEGWRLTKFDRDFLPVKEVIVPLPPGHAGNDQMLRVWDGRLYLSGLYNPNNLDTRSNKDTNPDEALYTHVWVYDTDLTLLEDHVLDGEPNINGGTLIPYRDGFAYIAADNFWKNNLKAYIYDGDWNFVRSVLLEENAQWAMGGVVDEERIYVAYHRGEHGQGDVVLDIFDMDWNRLEQIAVTAVSPQFNAQRPWVLLDGDRLFVAYDVGVAAPGVLDLQCMINVYTRGDPP
ncbi:MAG: exo-alpha-sialidase [Chloroflexi bacterium]|nr:MAG: exo-alpha-sialidase [Chloroflexota bacterium]